MKSIFFSAVLTLAIAFFLVSCQTGSMDEEETNYFVGTWETPHYNQTKKSILTFTKNTYSLTFGDDEGKETGSYSFGGGHIRCTNIVNNFYRYGQTQPEKRDDILGHYLFFDNYKELMIDSTINDASISSGSYKWRRPSL